MLTNVLNAENVTRHLHEKPVHTRYGKYKNNKVTQVETSCFIKFKNKIKDLFKATKRIVNRAIVKVEDFLYTAGTKISNSLEKMCEKVKNIKTPIRKNYVDVNILGYNAKIGKNAKVKDLFK
jgi:hypothetical protein